MTKIPELQREIREREGLIEFPVPNEPARKAPVELFDQNSEAEALAGPAGRRDQMAKAASVSEVLPVPLRCGLCGRRFALSPWDPAEGSFCSPDEGGCGATTRVSR